MLAHRESCRHPVGWSEKTTQHQCGGKMIYDKYILWEMSKKYHDVSVNGFNILRPRQYGRHFAHDIFKCIFVMKIYEFRSGFHWRLFLSFELTILKHWCRSGDKPLSEPIMVSLLTHIFGTRTQLINVAGTLHFGWSIMYLITSNDYHIHNSNYWNMDKYGSIKSSRPSDPYTCISVT